MIFCSEHIGTKEITVKVLEIIKQSLKNLTYSKAIRFRFIMQYHKLYGNEHEWRRLTRALSSFHVTLTGMSAMSAIP